MKSILILLLLPIVCFGQKIVENEEDKFNKSHRLKTSEVKLRVGLFAYIRTVTYLETGNTFYFFRLTGTGRGADVIGKDEKLIFLLDNDSTITVFSTEVQTYNIGRPSNTFNHQYQAQQRDIQVLSEHNVKSIRKHGVNGYIDFEIPDKNQDEIKNISLLILKELKK